MNILILQSLILLLIAVPINRAFTVDKVQIDKVRVDERGIPLYYWESRVTHDFTNFGDILSKKIVERIVGHRLAITFNPTFNKDNGGKKLLALGSIIHLAEDNDVIWCSGINGKHMDKTDKKFYKFTNLDVRAVRGPLTRQFLLEIGIKCPKIYGDPALLIPILFPEFKRQNNPSKEYIIIPHESDEHLRGRCPYGKHKGRLG